MLCSSQTVRLTGILPFHRPAVCKNQTTCKANVNESKSSIASTFTLLLPPPTSTMYIFHANCNTEPKDGANCQRTKRQANGRSMVSASALRMFPRRKSIFMANVTLESPHRNKTRQSVFQRLLESTQTGHGTCEVVLMAVNHVLRTKDWPPIAIDDFAKILGILESKNIVPILGRQKLAKR